MIEINNLEELINEIKENEIVLVYYSNNSCSICEVLKNKINLIINKKFNKIKTIEININKNQEIYGYYNIFASPMIIIYFFGKEFFRYGRNISMEKFTEDIKRPYGMLK